LVQYIACVVHSPSSLHNTMALKKQHIHLSDLQHIKSAVDNSPFGIYILDRDVRFVYVSEGFCRMTDLTADELYEDTAAFFNLIHTDDVDAFFAANEAALNGFHEFSHELRLVTGGRIRWFWVRSLPKQEEDGTWYWHGTMLDITNRKEIERRSDEARTRYETFTAISNTGAWEYDMRNDRLWFSEEYLAMIGLDARQYRLQYGEKMQNWIDLMHPEDRNEANRVFQSYLADETDTGIYETFFRLKHSNGSWVWIWSRGRKLCDEQGRFQGKVLGTHINVTETKEREQRLKESNTKYRIAAEFSPDWEYWVRPDGTFEYISPFCEQISGYTADEFMKDISLFEKIIYSEDKPEWERHKRLHIGGEKYQNDGFATVEFRIQHKDGSIHWIEHICRPIFDDTGVYLGQRGTNRDVTQRHATGSEMKKLLKAVQNSPATVVITDRDGNIEYVNPKFTEVTGYTPGEVIGQNPRILKSEFKSREEYENLWNTILSGKSWTGEFKNIKKNGEAYWEHAMISPITDETGFITHFIAIKEDITQLKKREDELKEVIEIVSDQNKRLQEFNYILSHNIRSYAANIAAILTESKAADDESTRRELMGMLDTVSEGLLSTLYNLNENLSIQREVNVERTELDLKTYTDKILADHKIQLAESGIQVSVAISPDCTVSYNPAYLQSVLQNLVTNAIRYRSEKRTPIIEIKARRNGEFVEMTVRDNGIGIDLKRHGSRLFGLRQVFTDNPEARGLGLYIVRNQVSVMGGRIDVDSSPGQGTTFTVWMPAGAY